MTWNYRVLCRRHDMPHAGQVDSFYIIETYYGSDGEEIVAWADAPTPVGDTLEELRSDIALMARALDLDVLSEIDLPAE